MTRGAGRANGEEAGPLNALSFIADDVTGACDVAAELATAGHRVEVVTGASAAVTEDGVLRIVNTQSRMLSSREAYARVLEAVQEQEPGILLKKIDTALRGHLGAELDAVLDGWPGATAFVLAAIPSAGRVTRSGRQWFGEHELAETEFAGDSEGAGGESSIAGVLALESERRVDLIDLTAVRDGRCAEHARAMMRRGCRVFVVDAETDDDVERAVDVLVTLPKPLCLAGSIALVAACAGRRPAPLPSCRGGQVPELTSRPVLVVSGSLHSRARSQCAAAVAAGCAVEMSIPMTGAATRYAALGAVATAHLASGRNVILSAPVPEAHPEPARRRAMQERMALFAARLVGTASVGTLALIGGETAHAILTTLQGRRLTITGRVMPLIAHGEIASGPSAGMTVITKGGSGGDDEALARILGAASGSRSEESVGR